MDLSFFSTCVFVVSLQKPDIPCRIKNHEITSRSND